MLLSLAQINEFLDATPGWTCVEGSMLRRAWKFADFAQALQWCNEIGAVAEALNHHPDIELGWGRLQLTVHSHDAGGLTKRDLRFAQVLDVAWETRPK